MDNPRRGEVWLVDLELAAKVHPCLVLSLSPRKSERALYMLVAHTTSMRGTRFEVEVQAKFLRSGVFGTQNILTIPRVKLVRKLGKLSPSELNAVEEAVRLWLGL